VGKYTSRLISSWQGLPARTRWIIGLGSVAVLILIIWLVWPMISDWRARRAFEASRIQTDAAAAQANNEAQQIKGQLQQLQSDFNQMKVDYENTKQQINQLQTDLAAAQQASRQATATHQQAIQRQKAFVPRRDAGSLSDDALRRDAGAAERAIKQ
jgi:septal ring factor EnvC (AmiA/AmiB activator)